MHSFLHLYEKAALVAANYKARYELRYTRVQKILMGNIEDGVAYMEAFTWPRWQPLRWQQRLSAVLGRTYRGIERRSPQVSWPAETECNIVRS